MLNIPSCLLKVKMTRKTNQIISFLFTVLSVSITLTYAYVYDQYSQNLTQTIKNTKLWVDSFDNSRHATSWVTQGSSPYLNAQDEPNNYVYTDRAVGGDQIGDFGFEDHAQTGTINSIKLKMYGHAYQYTPNDDYFDVYLWDGNSWNKVMSFQGLPNYVWQEAVVTSYLNTWQKVNGAKIYLEKIGKLKRSGIACDAALLVVDYA